MQFGKGANFGSLLQGLQDSQLQVPVLVSYVIGPAKAVKEWKQLINNWLNIKGFLINGCCNWKNVLVYYPKKESITLKTLECLDKIQSVSSSFNIESVKALIYITGYLNPCLIVQANCYFSEVNIIQIIVPCLLNYSETFLGWLTTTSVHFM